MPSTLSLLQLNVNLIEGEPFNCLTPKKRQLISSATISNTQTNLGNLFQNPIELMPSVWSQD